MNNPEAGHDIAPDSHNQKKPNMFRKLAALVVGSAALTSGAEAVNHDSQPPISISPEPQGQAVEKAPVTSIEQPTSQEQAPNPEQTPSTVAASPTTTETAHLIPPVSMTNSRPQVEQAPPTTAEVTTETTEQERVLHEKIKNGESFDLLQGKIARVQVSIEPDKFIIYDINDPIELKAPDGKVIGVIGFLQTDDLPNWQGDSVMGGNPIVPGETFQPIFITLGEKTQFSNSTVQVAGYSKPATVELTEANKTRTPIDIATIGSLPTTQTKITENESGVYIDLNGQYPATAVQMGAGL